MRRKWAAGSELSENFDERRHVGGQFAFEAKLVAADRVFEAENRSMQRLAWKRCYGNCGFFRV